jgi:hypothetical protein
MPCRPRKPKERTFFFVNKKEAKKTLIPLDRARETARGPKSKSFLLLFSKEKRFLHPNTRPLDDKPPPA